ncbi:pyridoxal phosphate-dependent aminotransferase [Haliangium sp.]|uniref:pyridoxal phosphate-dependent aminotransferase n=1 Tax=Haliangium sp. TaxID=2663208 RepID=UPI003D0AC8AA
MSARVHLDLRVRGGSDSATVAINERSHELSRQGRQVFKLGFGQSPFPVPEPVVQALRDNAHRKDYLPVRGLAELRAAVAEFHDRRDGLGRSAAQVLIGPGSKELMFLLQLVCYGDLLLPSPAWVSYAPQARILGRAVDMVDTHPEDGWRLRPEALDAACRADPDRPRLLILNYPSNPVGTTLDADELAALAEVARRYRLLVLSDEIYGELHHRGEHVSMARFYPEGTIVSSGLSKWCGAGGWRLGTFLFPPGLDRLVDAMSFAASETFTTASAPIQYAAVRAFAGGAELDGYLDASRRLLGALGQWVAACLGAAGAGCAAPEGGFYLFPDFEPQRERLAARGIHGSQELCRRLLEDTGVAVLAGQEFGRPAAELSFRLAYVDFDGEAALAALTPDTSPDEAFLRAHCNRVCEAAERLGGWLADA